MAQKVNLTCGACKQVLAVDAALAGKRVRCPKCQGTTVVPPVRKPTTTKQTGPQQRAPKQTAASQSAQAKQQAAKQQTAKQQAVKSDSQITVCPKCSKKMAVKLLDQPSEIQCPQCSTRLRLPAKPQPAKPQPAKPQPAMPQPAMQASAKPRVSTPQAASPATPPTQPQPTFAQPAQQAVAPTQQAAAPLPQAPASSPQPAASAPEPSFETIGPAAPADPFATDPFGTLPAGSNPAAAGHVDLGQIPSPQAGTAPGGFPGQASAPPGKSATNPGVPANGFLAWVVGHKLLSAIIAVNLACLMGCALLPEMLIVLAVQIPMGMLLAGALFLPRLHIIDRISEAIGGQAAGMGAGGIALLVMLGMIKIGLRASRRINRNDNLDFSGFDPSSIGSIIVAGVIMIACAGLFIFLWKQFGVVRVLAAGYVVEMVLFMPIFFAGGILTKRKEAEFRREADEAIERLNDPDFMKPPTFSGPRPMVRPPVSPFADSSVIRITVSHGPNADPDEVKSTLLECLGKSDCETASRGSFSTEFILDDDRSPKEVAKLIDFGRVMFASDIARAIHVSMPRR